MTLDQWAAVLTAAASLLAAVAGVLHSHSTRKQVRSLETWTGKRPSTGDRKTPKR